VGIIALATSTYTVVTRIAKFEIIQASNVSSILELSRRTTALENDRLPNGIELGRLGVTLEAMKNSLDRMETKIERLQGYVKKADTKGNLRQ